MPARSTQPRACCHVRGEPFASTTPCVKYVLRPNPGAITKGKFPMSPTKSVASPALKQVAVTTSRASIPASAMIWGCTSKM
eukprot:1533474-Rhodomonas_salina.1